MFLKKLLLGRKEEYKVSVDVHTIGAGESIPKSVIVKVEHKDELYTKIKDIIENRFEYLINYDIGSIEKVV